MNSTNPEIKARNEITVELFIDNIVRLNSLFYQTSIETACNIRTRITLSILYLRYRIYSLFPIYSGNLVSLALFFLSLDSTLSLFCYLSPGGK